MVLLLVVVFLFGAASGALITRIARRSGNDVRKAERTAVSVRLM